MRLHRFYTSQKLKEGEDISLSDLKLSHQVRKVFRLVPGNEIILFDGSGSDFVSEIADFREGGLEVRVKERREGSVPDQKLHFFIAIAKKDNFEWAVEKCTEIGVSEFTPVISDRTEKKNVDMDRLASIIKEASEQSGRADVPKMNAIASFDDVIRENGKDLALFHLDGESFPGSNGGFSKILIGPEGGWSDREIEAARISGVRIVSLGRQVLRAETACAAIAALLLLK